MKTVGVEVVSSDEEDTLTQKMAKYRDPTPINYSSHFTVDINRSPDDPLFYRPNAKTPEHTSWLPDPVVRGHVATLLRIVQEIALEDLKFNKTDFTLDQWHSDARQGRIDLRIRVEKSALCQCCMELIPPGFLNVIHVIIHYDSTDKILIDNRIEISGISNEKAADTVKRHTFPRNQAVSILYLAMHKPAAKAAWVWYKCALASVHKEMAPKRPKYIEMVTDTDATTQGLEIRAMRQSSDEEPAVKKTDAKEPVGKYYDEALRLAHIILSEPRVPPLIGALYGVFSIVLDFGYVCIMIRPTAQYRGKFRVGMGKNELCGEVTTDDPRRAQEVLLDTTKLTIREMRLKYDQVYQRQCQKAKTEVVDELDDVELQ